MSHFTVLVITEDGDYEKALAPFDENIEVEPYIRRSRADIVREYNQENQRAKEGSESKKEYFLGIWGAFDLTDEDEIVNNYRKYWEDCETFDEMGNQLSTYNPNSKWDWYSLGGRWNGSLKLKEGSKVVRQSDPSLIAIMAGDINIDEDRTDFAQVKDIDFTPDEGAKAEAERFWEVVVEGEPLKENENPNDFGHFYNSSYYLEKYGDKETYVEDTISFSTYALLYKGQWYEPGQMGWFGMSSAGPMGYAQYRKVFKEALTNVKPTDYLAVVDCHI